MSIIGGSDKMTIQNWYAGASSHVETFTASDGKTLDHAAVDALVGAMAAFSPPSAGQTTLPPSYQAALGSTIAGSWT